jgi:hypothetical protein
MRSPSSMPSPRCAALGWLALVQRGTPVDVGADRAPALSRKRSRALSSMPREARSSRTLSKMMFSTCTLQRSNLSADGLSPAKPLLTSTPPPLFDCGLRALTVHKAHRSPSDDPCMTRIGRAPSSCFRRPASHSLRPPEETLRAGNRSQACMRGPRRGKECEAMCKQRGEHQEQKA